MVHELPRFNRASAGNLFARYPLAASCVYGRLFSAPMARGARNDGLAVLGLWIADRLDDTCDKIM